jgi:hypothetical protein
VSALREELNVAPSRSTTELRDQIINYRLAPSPKPGYTLPGGVSEIKNQLLREALERMYQVGLLGAPSSD